MRKSGFHKTKKWLAFGLPIFALLLIIACSKKDDDGNVPEQAVSITSFSPSEGEKNEIVTIIGENFGATMADNSVSFGSTTAEITSASATQLTAKVPEGASSGKIKVSVGTSSATSTETFNVLVDPTASVEITPSLNYVTNDFEIGESVSIDVTVTAEEGISALGLYKSVNGLTPVAIEEGYEVPEVGDTEFSATYIFVITDAVDDEVEYIVMAKDEDDEEFVEASHAINVAAQGLGGSGGLYRLLKPKTQNLGYGTQGNDYPDCLDTGLPETGYLAENVPELPPASQMAIDITLGTTNLNADAVGFIPRFISPDYRQSILGLPAFPPENSSTTKFNEVEGLTSLDGITSTDVETNIGSEGDSTVILSEGGVYSFINEAGSKGYIKVNEIVGEDNSDDRVVFLEILVQEPQVIQ